MIDPNHVLKVGAATDLYVEQLQARNAELEKEVARLKEIAIPVFIDYGDGAEEVAYGNVHQVRRLMKWLDKFFAQKQQLAIAEEHNARLVAGIMKAALHVRPTCDELYYELKAIYTLPASREALDAYVVERVKEAKAELETERMRLAACGVAALGYFEGCCDEYHSASLGDTLRLYAKYEAATKQRDLAVSAATKARNAAQQCASVCSKHLDMYPALLNMIDVVDGALSAINESEV